MIPDVDDPAISGGDTLVTSRNANAPTISDVSHPVISGDDVVSIPGGAAAATPSEGSLVALQ